MKDFVTSTKKSYVSPNFLICKFYESVLLASPANSSEFRDPWDDLKELW